MPEFRDFLALWLQQRGWSANRLAEEAGIAQTLVSRYLNPNPRRRIRPTDETLRKLAPVLGRSHDDLMRMVGRLDKTSDEVPPESDDTELLVLFRQVPSEDKPTLKSIVRKYAIPPVTEPYRRRVTDLDTSLDRPKMDSEIASHPRIPRWRREMPETESQRIARDLRPAFAL